MEWVALVMWAIVAAIAMPLAAGAIFGRGSLGLQALAAFGGLALTIIICINGVGPIAWVAFGLAGLGAVTTAAAAAGLTSEQGYAVAGIQAVEEQQAGLAGVQLILFLTLIPIALMLSLEIALA